MMLLVRITKRTAAGGFLAVLLLAAAAAAQPAASHPADSLPQRQAAIRESLRQIETRMVMLARLLAETEPDKAERLRQALTLAGEKQLQRRFERVVELLGAGQFSEAEREQQALLGDLGAMLQRLTDTASDLDRKRTERLRLEGYKGAIRTLMQQQFEELYQTRQARAAAEPAERLRAAAERLVELAEEQRELRESDASEEARAAEQRALAARLQPAAEQVRAAREQERDADARVRLDDALEDAEQARASMRTAAEALERDAADPAAAAQQAAEEQLRRAVRRLEEEAERLARRAELRELEADQRQTERAAAELESEMAPPQPEAPAAPGQKQVGGARRNMQDAADRLGERQPAQAEPQQEMALEQMQRALDELDDALRQVRREEMEETLTALETRFRGMLERERRVRDDVTALPAEPAAEWDRTDRLRLEEAAQTQHQVAEECAAVHRILVGEGTTVILPELVEQLRTDLHAIAGRLDAADTGSPTLVLLDAVIAALEEILNAVEVRRQEEAEQASDPQQGGSVDASRPLLPPSAELKLLRSAQVRINERTAALAGVAASRPAPGPAAAETVDAAARFNAAEHLRLAQRQMRLMSMARHMNERK